MSTLALKLPQNYLEVEKEEMQYLDGGGFSPKTFNKSMSNLAGRFGSRVLSQSGAFPVAAGVWTYWTIVTVIGARVAATVGTAASIVGTPIGGIVAGIIASAGIAGFIYYMGSGTRFG